MQPTKDKIKLTQYSHGAGCGCKIAPAILDKILKTSGVQKSFPSLVVGNVDRDDAAVVDIGNGIGIISTTDFFMPIVDDPFTFGQIAAVNAISDIYAMGGEPIMAIAILGWPVNQLDPSIANQVVEGGRKACEEAGIALAGGHSIDSPEPIFGLAVSGKIQLKNIKQNSNAQKGDSIFLTKPLGVGILATAQKKGKLEVKDELLAINNMIKPNKFGVTASKIEGVNAMTDVTGFGLLGHLIEICKGSGVGAMLDLSAIPMIDSTSIPNYINEGCIPGGTNRNWASYGAHVDELAENHRVLLADPQTSGGLLITCNSKDEDVLIQALLQAKLPVHKIGSIVAEQTPLISF